MVLIGEGRNGRVYAKCIRETEKNKVGQAEKVGVPISSSPFGHCDMIELLQMNGTDAEQVATSAGV